MIYSVGVDTGSKNGALAIIDKNLNIVSIQKTPYYTTDIKSRKLKNLVLDKESGKYKIGYRKRSWVDYTSVGDLVKPLIKKTNQIIYTVERVSVRPGEGEASSFNFGTSMGVFLGLYPLINPIDFYNPIPQVWKKELGVTSDKSSSIDLAQEIFSCNLKDYLKKGKVDDVAEALLLAFYGLMHYYKKEEEQNGTEKE
jgi:hypothetical protein